MKKFFFDRVVRCWNKLFREGVESQSSGAFRERADVALKDMD